MRHAFIHQKGAEQQKIKDWGALREADREMANLLAIFTGWTPPFPGSLAGQLPAVEDMVQVPMALASVASHYERMLRGGASSSAGPDPTPRLLIRDTAVRKGLVAARVQQIEGIADLTFFPSSSRIELVHNDGTREVRGAVETLESLIENTGRQASAVRDMPMEMNRDSVFVVVSYVLFLLIGPPSIACVTR